MDVKTGLVYMHINKTTKKAYIGQTITTMSRRWAGHVCSSKSDNTNNYFHNAIRKYGKDDWQHLVLESSIPIIDLDERELHYINFYEVYGKGYNSIGSEKANAGTHKKLFKISGTNSSSFKPWWYMTPTGEFIEVNDVTQKEFCIANGFSYKAFSGLNHGKIVEQGPMKGWSFGIGTLDKLEYVSNINLPKRKSPTTKGKPRDTSFNNKVVLQYNKDTEELIASYESAKAAAIALGLKNSNQIARAARGERRIGAGFIWKYS